MSIHGTNGEKFGFQSMKNTTSALLGSGETYTGNSEKSGFPDVMTSCYSDTDGTLYYDFSVDNTNWRTFPISGFTVSAGTHEFHIAVKGPRYFRVRFVNGSTSQSEFQLGTYCGVFRQSSAPLNQSVSSDADAIVVRSVDPSIDLALGRISGMEEDEKFGLVEDIDVADGAVDLWAYKGLRTAPTSTFTPYIASTNAADTDVIRAPYLDSNGDRATVDVTLNGQTPVSLGVTATDVVRAYEWGTTAALGDVAITTANNFTAGAPTNQGEVLVQIPAGFGRSQLAADRVPTGYEYRIKHARILLGRDNGSNGSALITLDTRLPGKTWQARVPLKITQATAISTPIAGLVLTAGTAVRLRIRSVSDDNTSFSGSWAYDVVRV